MGKALERPAAIVIGLSIILVVAICSISLVGALLRLNNPLRGFWSMTRLSSVLSV